MTTPAITQLLEQHRAIVESRELSFDEKVDWLLAHAENVYGILPARLSTIREALRADQSRRLSEAARRVAEHEAQANAERAESRTRQSITDRHKQITTDRRTEQDAIRNITNSMDLNDPIVVENLQLHIKRLAALQRKQ